MPTMVHAKAVRRAEARQVRHTTMARFGCCGGGVDIVKNVGGKY